MRSVLERTGLSLWNGLLANVVMAAMTAASLVRVAPGATVHDGIEALGIIIWGILIALVGLPLSVYDLVKRRWWGLAGLALSLTPAPVCLTLFYALMRAKGISSDIP